MLLKFANFLIPVLIASILISCSASRHAGVNTILEPPLAENDQSVWFAYYEDQFDALKGNVIVPTSQYPECAHRGYEQAKNEWNERVKYARGGTTLLYMGSVVGGVGLALLLFSVSKHDQKVGW